MLWRILISGALTLVLVFLPMPGPLSLVLYLIPYLIIGYDILLKAVKGIGNGQLMDENFLMSVATVGAFVLAFLGRGEYTEAVAVMLFYQIGELFQSIAVGKSRRSIGALLDIRPDSANLETGDGVVTVDPGEVPIGSVIVIRPGERIPLDGQVIEGESDLDTAALSGESLPRCVAAGDRVISGCINLSGLLRVRTETVHGESTVSKILALVENAGSRKSRSEAFISKFARVYTPVVCIFSLCLCLFPPLGALLLKQDPMWMEWIYRGLTFLVISCPCALVISIPLCFFATLGGSSRQGILIKGSNYLEILSRAGTVVFDKTGTLTKGQFSVTRILAVGMEQELLLYYAAHAESASSHPIAKSILQAYGGEIFAKSVEHIREIAGKGVCAVVDGKTVLAGNASLLTEEGIVPVASDALAGTAVHLAVNGCYAGCILLDDTLKEGAKAAVADLRQLGVGRLVMLTGDNAETAHRVASELGLDGVYSDLLPGDKVEVLESIMASENAGRVVFVGDGINDSPVLSRADVGIAMGSMGSDAAVEAADVVLMDDDPRRVALSIRLCRRCMAIVWQNIVFAIGIKVICLLLGALGFADLWLAIFADVGVMVLVVCNSVRMLVVSKKEKIEK